MDSVRERKDGVATIFDYSSFSGGLIVNNLRCTIGIEQIAVVNITDPMHVGEFEVWADDLYNNYDDAIREYVRVGYWPVLLATAQHVDKIGRNNVSYLTDYRHPPKAVYIIGPDNSDSGAAKGDDAFYENLVTKCNDVITIPSDDRELYGVTALTIALWDRHIKNWFAFKSLA